MLPILDNYYDGGGGDLRPPSQHFNTTPTLVPVRVILVQLSGTAKNTMAEEHTFSGVAGTIMGTEDMMSPKVFNRSEARTDIQTQKGFVIFFSRFRCHRPHARSHTRSHDRTHANTRTLARTCAHTNSPHTRTCILFWGAMIFASGSISSVLKIAAEGWVRTVPQNYAQTE